MYEYNIETLQIAAKALNQKPNAEELNALLELINKKANEGWELVTNTFMAGSAIPQTFICTFKREKK